MDRPGAFTRHGRSIVSCAAVTYIGFVVLSDRRPVRGDGCFRFRIAIRLAACLALVSLPAIESARGCDETVLIDSVEYAVSDRWCGKQIAPEQMAQPTRMLLLPQELTFEDYRIYVAEDAGRAFVQMAASARSDSVTLIVDSGYRSVAYQTRIIARRLAGGQSFARIMAFVAPPGYSEHHTGQAFDLVPSDAGFADTEAYRWLSRNADRFGFKETLPPAVTDSAGWESWHWVFLVDTTASAEDMESDPVRD